MKRQDLEHQWLQTIPLFSACTPAELGVIGRNTTRYSFAPGDVLMHEGALGHEFFVIVDGTVLVHVTGGPDVRIGPGEFVGEMALLGQHPRSATVVAETDVTVLVSSLREFSACLDGAPEVARRLLAGMADRLRAADEALAGSGNFPPGVTRR